MKNPSTITSTEPVDRRNGAHAPSDTSLSGELRALRELFAALNAEAVPYCHWKSNLRLADSLAGRTDLDLLVGKSGRGRFLEILQNSDIRRVLAPRGSRYPGLEDYLGVDTDTGRIFHLHVHDDLVLGQQFVKNYRLPFADHFLNHSTLQMGVRVPQPAYELVVLALRVLLKYRDRDVVKDTLGIRSPGIPDHIRLELLALIEKTTPAEIDLAVASLGSLSAGTVRKLLNVVSDDPRDGLRLHRLRTQVFRSLHPFQRRSRLVASAQYFREAWRRRNTFLRFTAKKKKTWPGTGPMIAIIGADGSGKTSHTRDLAGWLGNWMEVRRYYFGSKQPSLASRFLYLAFRAFRKAARDTSRLLGDGNAIVRMLVGARQNLRYLHEVSIGLDRYRRFRQAARDRRAGITVICDRFPLIGMLDGPQIPIHASGHPLGRIGRVLSEIEDRMYTRMSPPPLVWLDVSPAVAAKRKPDHEADTIAAKVDVLQKVYRDQAVANRPVQVYPVDADSAYDEVSLALKQVVWCLAGSDEADGLSR